MLRVAFLALVLAGVASQASAQDREIARPAPNIMLNVDADALSRRPLREGDVLLSVPYPHEAVGRLQNDLRRRGWGEDIVVMPRGTPLFRTTYSYRVMMSQRISRETVHEANWPMWCGPTTTEADRGVVGHCIIVRRGRAEVARVVGSSLHSAELSAWSPATAPRIAIDRSAAREIRPARLVYRIDRLRRGHVVVRLDLEENGRVETWERLRASRRDDGTAQLSIEGLRLAVRPAGEAIRIELADASALRRVAASRY